MKKQFFFLVGLAVITGGFLLVWDSPPESFLRPQTGKVDKLPSADSYMINITSYKFSKDGDKQFSLKSSKMSLFNKKSQLILEKPVLVAKQMVEESGELNVIADSGSLSKDTQIFEFTGQVNANWETTDGQILLTSGRLTYSVPSSTAKAYDGVQLKTPQAEITGKTLSADFQTEIFTIESSVRAVYEPI